MKSALPMLAVVFASIATLDSTSLAGENVNCAAVANGAALQAVNNRTSPLGQTFTIGQPFVFGRDLLRAEVEVFGAQDLLYWVDVKVDGACRVLATSIQLESNPWRFR